MVSNYVFKIAILVASLLIMQNGLAMDWEFVEASIESIIEAPLNHDAINQLSTELKKFSAPKPQEAINLLNKAYTLLISQNKFDEAQHLLSSLESDPRLKGTVEKLEQDLAIKISAATPPAPQIRTDEELGLAQVVKLIRKEPFTLADAKEVQIVIETAIINNWKINIPKLLKIFLQKSLQSFVSGSLDRQITILLAQSFKRELIKSEINTRILIAEMFLETLPTIPFKNEPEREKSRDFIRILLDAFMREQLINPEEYRNYAKTLAQPQPVQPPIIPQRQSVIPPQPPIVVQRPPVIPQQLPVIVQRPPTPPVKPEADPEIAPVIKEHAISKNDLEGKRIESTKEGDFLIPLMDYPTEFKIQDGKITIRVQQMPSLSQLEYRGKKPEEVIKELTISPTSNYCGYYAAYNLWCVATNQQQNIMNRQLFVAHFGSMLLTIKKNDLEEIKKEEFALMPEIHKHPYDELAGYEIEYLLKKEFNISPALYLALYESHGQIQSVSESLQAFNSRTGLLADFRAASSGQTKSLPILFNVEANHWIAIKAIRHGNTVTFEMYDSLGKRNWQDIDETPSINTNILKVLGAYLMTRE